MVKKKSSKKKVSYNNKTIVIGVIVLVILFVFAFAYQGSREDEEGLGSFAGGDGFGDGAGDRPGGGLRDDPKLTNGINKIFGSGSGRVNVVKSGRAPDGPTTRIILNYDPKELKAALVEAAKTALSEKEGTLTPKNTDYIQLTLTYDSGVRMEYTTLNNENKGGGGFGNFVVQFPKEKIQIKEVLATPPNFPAELVGVVKASLNPVLLENIDTSEGVSGFLKPSKVKATGFRKFFGRFIRESFNYRVSGAKEQEIKLSPNLLIKPKGSQGSEL